MRIDSAIITGSFSVNGDTFNDLGSYSTTGSNTFVGNQSIVGAVSASALTGSIDYTNITNVPTLVSGSEQIVGILSPLNSFSASNSTTNTFTSSATARLNSIETITASNISRLTNLESITGSLATTGSNTFIGTQTITGSLFISANLIVQGTSSLQNITASAVSIGTNLINLNTANPAIRYAGLVIGDSGSVGGSGSFLYDSVQDEMIFIHRGTSTVVTSSVVLMGPQTFDTIGTETYPTANRIQKGTGNEHLVDSCIIDDGTTVCVNANLRGSSTISGTSLRSNGVGTFGFNTANNGEFQIYGTALDGIIMAGRGSSNDMVITNKNGSDVFRIPTGTIISNFIGNVCAPSFVLANGNCITAIRNTGGASIGILGISSGTDTLFLKGATSGASPAIQFQDTGGTIATFYNSNLGIGASTPSERLDVFGPNGSVATIRWRNDGGRKSGYLYSDSAGVAIYDTVLNDAGIYLAQNSQIDFRVGGTQRMIITCGGNVGINTISPNASSPLHVRMCSNSNGDGIRVQAMCTGGAGSQPGIAFSNTSDCKRWNIAMDTNSDTFQITNAGGSNVFNITQSCVVCTGPVTIVGMQGGGDTTVIAGGSGYGSSIRMNYASGPYNNYLAGNGDNFFNCVTGKLNAQGGVKFGGGSGTLNHYESGTWTPQLYWSSGGQYCMSGGNGGNYVRIGNVVHVNYTLQWSALCGSSGFGGQLRIGGLPFAVGGYRSAGTISAISSGIGRSVTGITYHALTADPGQNFIYWIENDPTGGYGHSPSVGASGLVYSNQLTYTLH